jgi:hypothetical protein
MNSVSNLFRCIYFVARIMDADADRELEGYHS